MREEPRIEIWRSKPLWRNKDTNERKRLFVAFTQAVQAHEAEAGSAENGPFLIEKTEWSLLIWMSPPSGSSRAVKVVADIAVYFEPMLFVSLNDHLTLTGLVEKLSGRSGAVGEK